CFGHVSEHGGRGARELSQRATALGTDRFAGDQGRLQIADCLGTCLVKLLTPVQKRHDDPGIEQYRLHLPKSRKCFLFEPRSETPEQNLPKPMTPRLFLRK